MLEANDFVGLLGFLDKIKDKGEINRTTAQARKTACEAVIEMVAKDEPHTVEWVKEHLDDLMRRLMHKDPSRLTQRSAETYRSRVISSISDYLAYQRDPLGWRPKAGRPLSGDGRKSTEKKSAASRNGPEDEQPKSHATGEGDSSTSMTYQFPLRPGYMLEIRNIPRDLKTEEVYRFACFMVTLAQDFRPGGSPFGEMVVAAKG